MAESPSAVPALRGLAVTAVEWLPSGAESGLIRVRGRWTEETAREPDLPVLALRAGGADHRFESLPDARFSREPDSWRGTYLVPAELVATDPEALWLEWSSGARAGLPGLSRGVEPPPVPAAPERPEEPDEPGGQVIDRAVLAERRARRAEAAEQAQARVAAEALKAVEVLELRSAELERRLQEATAERDALASGGAEAAGRREALAAALASAAALRLRSRDWQVRLRATEVVRASDAVRLAVLEAERATGTAAMRSALQARGAELEAARREAADRGAELEAARREAADRGAELAVATEAAASARADLEAGDRRFVEARAAWDRRRDELEAALIEVRGELATAREEAGVRAGELEAQREVQHELERTATDARSDAERLREQIGALEAALAVAEGRIQTGEVALAEVETRLRVETVARTTLEDELDRERSAHAAQAASQVELERLRGELEAERDARRAAEEALAAARAQAERAGTTLQERIAELERRAAAAPELERLAREHATEREPVADAARLVADLDAAAEALRRRSAPTDDESPTPRAADSSASPAGGPPAAAAGDSSARPAGDPPAAAAGDSSASPAGDSSSTTAEGEPEPPAPDAEPAVEWGEPVDEPPRTPCVPGVEPARPAGDPDAPHPWTRPGSGSAAPTEGGEPPAPDAEPAVESTPPVEPPPPEAPQAPEPEAPPADASAALPQPTPPTPESPSPASVAPSFTPDNASSRLIVSRRERGHVDESSAPSAKPVGPIIVPASGPPARALAIGSERRDYPVLRGAIVKLAHDDPAAAAALLVALLPAQGVAIEGPLGYDLTIREAGTFAVAIAGGRASVEQIDFPRPRGIAAFHLTADALVLAELLAGVEQRIGRFFGPVRVRGRKRRVKELRALPASTATLAEAARAGARLDPGLVYRLLAYAVHPSWTRGHEFTIAQAITGAPPETWYLTASDGAGVSVSSTPPAGPPDATVTMSREAFDQLLRDQPLPAGQRPNVRGDHSAVATMRAWTLRAQSR